MRVIAFLLTGWMCGCAAGDAATHAVVRDSAGVRIVENDVARGALPGFVIGEEAVVEIGVVEGEEAYQLDDVQLARWLVDGSIAVVNGGSSEVRVFDGEGRFVRSYGGRGDGPGEYQAATHVWQHGDSLVVYDWRSRRVTVTPLAAAEGPGGRTISIDRGPYYNEMWFGAGAVVVPIKRGGAGEVGEWADIAIDYMRVPLDGTTPDTIARVPGGREGLIPFNTGGGQQAVLTGKRLFDGRARAAFDGVLFYAGASFERRIAVFDTTGRRVREIRWTSVGEPVSAQRLEAYIQHRIAAVQTARGVREGVESFPRADTFPHFDGLLTDGSGRLWVRRFDLPGDPTPPRWTVFDTAGVAQAIVEMPRGVTVYEARSDRVLGMRADSLGVQHVVVLPIRRGG